MDTDLVAREPERRRARPPDGDEERGGALEQVEADLLEVEVGDAGVEELVRRVLATRSG
jgi:hypothetical protein